MKSKLKFKYFNDKYFAVKLSGVEFLYVSGSAIDDEIFDDLLKNDGLRNTSKLHISRTPLTMTSIEKLISLKKLNKLYIDSEILSLEDMKKFKSQRPACYLEFNRTKVTD